VKYRSKPVEAVQITHEMVDTYVLDGGQLPPGVECMSKSWHQARMEVYSVSLRTTFTPRRSVEAGDWIVTNHAGQRSVMSAESFAFAYEPAVDEVRK
jgi:hypothetical protein